MKLSQPTLEGLKEILRTFVLGEIPVLIAVLGVIKAGIDVEVGGFSIRWMLVVSILAAGTVGVIQTAVMSGIDKFIHKNDIQTPLDLRVMDSLGKQS